MIFESINIWKYLYYVKVHVQIFFYCQSEDTYEYDKYMGLLIIDTCHSQALSTLYDWFGSLKFCMIAGDDVLNLQILWDARCVLNEHLSGQFD